MLACFQLGTPDAANQELLDRYGLRFLGRRIKGPTDYLYQGPLCEMTLHTEISRHIEEDTVNIVELGSGYGKNLFRLWLNGGPPRAKYLAFEFTTNGRTCASYLASLEPSIQFETRAFDYYAPKIDGFDRNAKTFVFTNYSIEQIPTIGTAVFEELLAMPGLAKVVHVEPVGWQRPRGSIVDEVELELQGVVERFARASSSIRICWRCASTSGRRGASRSRRSSTTFSRAGPTFRPASSSGSPCGRPAHEASPAHRGVSSAQDGFTFLRT